MFKSLKSVTYQVADVEQAKQWYREILKTEPVFDSPFYVVFSVGDFGLALTPAANTTPENDERGVAYWYVDDIEAAYQQLLEAGAAPHAEIHPVLNLRTARVVDPFGNIVGLTGKISDQKTSVEDKPSESAMTVVFCRALAAREEREERRGPDYLAEIFLIEDSKRPLQDRVSREWVIKNMVTPKLYGYFMARTAYLDGMFEQALRADTPQIVFLGAGYDSRSYRFRDLIQNTRIFELDAQPTQQRKKELLHKAKISIPKQLTFVSINFKTDPLEEVLSKADFDPNQRTLFIWEGVTYYLPVEVVNNTLNSVKLSSPAGSTICFDYMTQAVPSTYTAEPFLFWIEPEKIEPFLAERGYSLEAHLTPEDIERKYLTLPDGSLAGKTLSFFCFVQACVAG